MAAKTRFGLEGYGVRPAGSFASKTIQAHPVARITRLGMEGYGVRRAGSFAGKSGAAPVSVTSNHPYQPILTLGRMMGR